jgi:hypothetical protein
VDLRTWIADDHQGLLTRFQQAIVAPVPTDRWRERPGAGGASIGFLRFHTALHEDIAMQAVVQGRPPLRQEWADRLGLGAQPPHAGLAEAEPVQLTAALDLEALVAYAGAVHAATAEWLDAGSLDDLDDVPPASARLARLGGVAVDDAPWLHRNWNDKTVGWFLQWEAIGHVQGHLGEMISVRGRLGLSPF